MLVDFNTPIKSFGGQPIRISEDNDDPLTLKVVAIDVLNRPLQDDANRSGVGYQLYTLSHKISKAEEPIELEAYEIELIKSRIEKHNYAAFILGPAWDALEGRTEPKG